MNEAVTHVKSWEQLSLTGDEVYEITARIGIVRDAAHVQYQLELRNPVTDELIELWSLPARHPETLDKDCAALGRELSRIMWERTGPF